MRGVWVAVWLVASGPAFGQVYVAPPCPQAPIPAFVDDLQPLWHRRFWTGDCRGLPALKCVPGRPYWNEVVKTLSARAPQARRASVAARACKLGRAIGFEWSRPSKVRRIDTGDLKAFNATLEKAGEVEAGLSAVEAAVKGKTGG